jgi:nitroimidazol reductase NimA-like FMN-containing flavoprotein (pyridoxamine 5'-phosphate oxidase superfamily)
MSKSAIESLTVDECWKLMATADLGRVGVVNDGGVDIFPVSFLVKDQVIYFSSAPGAKLMEMTRHPRVAFEADGIADRRRWSVVVRGEAKRLGFDSEIEESGVRSLRSMMPTAEWNYVRIEPRLVTGRRFTRRRR